MLDAGREDHRLAGAEPIATRADDVLDAAGLDPRDLDAGVRSEAREGPRLVERPEAHSERGADR
jgi:hypothetical protein